MKVSIVRTESNGHAFAKSFSCNLEAENSLCDNSYNKKENICGITIGTFDGFHKAHKALIKTLNEELSDLSKEVLSKDSGVSPYSVLITFYPHPRSVLSKNKTAEDCSVDDYSKLLNPLRARISMSLALGLDELRLINFTKNLSKVNAKDFLVKYIFEPLKPSVIVVGFDWSFGKGREGSIELLNEVSAQYNTKVVVLDKISEKEQKIGARQIRALLKEAKIKEANELLTYPFSIHGKVVKGDGRGKLIGVPTANINTVRQFLPRSGVYKTYTLIDGKKYLSVTNIGIRPTFKTDSLKQHIETHILDFSSDIYGKRISIEFHDWVRDEKKFSSVEELISQIHLDINSVRLA